MENKTLDTLYTSSKIVLSKPGFDQCIYYRYTFSRKRDIMTIAIYHNFILSNCKEQYKACSIRKACEDAGQVT